MSAYRAYLQSNGVEPDLRYDHAPQVDGATGVVIGNVADRPATLGEITGSGHGHEWDVQFDQHIKLGLPSDGSVGFGMDAFQTDEIEVIGHTDSPWRRPVVDANVVFDTMHGHLLAIRVKMPSLPTVQTVERGTAQWNAIEAYLREMGDIQ